ncbi:unnamed protein product [Oreochromis niloticus]|nr:unnamed protein product [Mustela putorius furo]
MVRARGGSVRPSTLLRDPPTRGKYAALKELLLRRYALSDAERAEKLLSLSGLGGGTALELMERMLSFLGPDDGGFLFAHIFLRQLPAAVRAGLANSPLLGTKDYRSLAEDVDRILLATCAFHDHDLVPASPAAPSTSPMTCPDVSVPSLAAKVSDPWSGRQHRQLAAISEFTTGIQHVAGKSNCVADCLCRALVSPIYVGIDFDAMAADQRADPDVLALRSEQTGLVLEDRPVWNGGPSLLCDVSTPCSSTFVASSRFRLRTRPLSSGRPVKLVSSRFVWQGLRKSVKDWAAACIPCQRAKIHRHTQAPLDSFRIPGRRFDHVHVDLVGPLRQSQVHHCLPDTFVPRSLDSSHFVFVRHDAHRPPLRPLYDGPFRVIQPGRKHFLLDFGVVRRLFLLTDLNRHMCCRMISWCRHRPPAVAAQLPLDWTTLLLPLGTPPTWRGPSYLQLLLAAHASLVLRLVSPQPALHLPGSAVLDV